MRSIRPEFVERRGPPSALWWLLLAGAMFAVVVQFRAYESRIESERQRTQTELAERRAVEQAEFARAMPSPLTESIKEMARLQAVAWPRVLAALETTPRGSIQINSIEIDVAERRADISVVGPNTKALLDYVEALNRGISAGDFAWRWVAWRIVERVEGAHSAELRGTWDQD